MLTVKVIREFNDEREGVLRKVGDLFTCSEDRLAEINSAGFGSMVEAVPDEVPAEEAPAWEDPTEDPVEEIEE